MLNLLSGVLGLASLVCFILVLIQMFQHGETTMGIVCIVLICCFGPLIAFVYGWINVGKWNIQNVMYAWTGIWLAQIVLAIVGAATGAFTPADVQFEQNF